MLEIYARNVRAAVGSRLRSWYILNWQNLSFYISCFIHIEDRFFWFFFFGLYILIMVTILMLSVHVILHIMIITVTLFQTTTWHYSNNGLYWYTNMAWMLLFMVALMWNLIKNLFIQFHLELMVYSQGYGCVYLTHSSVLWLYKSWFFNLPGCGLLMKLCYV